MSNIIREGLTEYRDWIISKIPRINNFPLKLVNITIFLLAMIILVEFLKYPDLNYSRLYLLYLMIISSKISQIYLVVK